MNRKQVAEGFAAQSPARGKASSMHYDGPVVYSYGEHFPLAVITAPGKVTVNTDKYSSTTSRHQSTVRAALVERSYDITEASTEAMKELARKVRA
jgi:hypothetical protein